MPDEVTQVEEVVKEEVSGNEHGKVGKGRPPKDKQFKPGQSGNPKGRKPQTPEEKKVKRAIDELVKEYKERLAQALPDISEVLVKSAIEGNMPAIKELNDRVMGKPEQKSDITSGGEKILVMPAELILKNESNTLTGDNSQGQSQV